jgi:predicted adenylyl cyclase CyaB
MGPARRNLELKAIDRDQGRSREICKGLGAEYRGILHQEDIYFDVPRGRLKLRRERGVPAHLIAYERSDDSGQRESRYRIVEIEDDIELEAALVSALGIKAVVQKARQLYLYEGVRIHLDRVNDLGNFIEFEGVATPGDSDLARFEALLADLRHSLGIHDADLIGGSYCDLVPSAWRPSVRFAGERSEHASP